MVGKEKWSEVFETQIAPSFELLKDLGVRQACAVWINENVYEDAQNFNSGSQLIEPTDNVKASQILLPLLHSYWSSKIESLFLKSQRLLDSVTCNYIILKDKSFSLELYHRIKAEEISFARAIQDFGVIKNNHMKFGMLVDKPSSNLPHGMHKVIATMKPGQLMPPLRINDEFCIIQLLNLKRPVLDEHTKDQLLLMTYEEWKANVKKIAISYK